MRQQRSHLPTPMGVRRRCSSYRLSLLKGITVGVVASASRRVGTVPASTSSVGRRENRRAKNPVFFGASPSLRGRMRAAAPLSRPCSIERSTMPHSTSSSVSAATCARSWASSISSRLSPCGLTFGELMKATAIQVAGRRCAPERRGLPREADLAWLEKLPCGCPTSTHFALDFVTMKGLRDVVAPGLRVLFVGINPGLRSAEIGHHFGGRTNPFWRLLHAAGFTPELLPPEQDRRMAEWRLGLPHLCARAARPARQ